MVVKSSAADADGGGGGKGSGAAAAAADGFLELWGPAGLASTVRVPSTVHGPFCTDKWFGGGGGWSPDRRRYIYAAEAPVPETGAPRDGGADGTAAAAPRDAKTVLGTGIVEAHADRDNDFGECYVRRRAPALFVVEWGGAVPPAGGGGGGGGRDGGDDGGSRPWATAAPAVSRLGGVPPGLAAGDAVWSPDGAAVACSARPTVGGGAAGAPAFQPGTRFFYNRTSAVYVGVAPAEVGADDADGNGGGSGGGGGDGDGGPTLTDMVCGSGDDGCARSPRFHPSGRALVWVATPWTGAHASTSTVRVGVRPAGMAAGGWAAAVTATLVGVVRGHPPETAIPGLYAHALPVAPWLQPHALVVNSAWGGRKVVLRVAVDLEAVAARGGGGDEGDSGGVDPAAAVAVAVVEPYGSAVVHDAAPGGVAIVEVSGPDTPPWVAFATDDVDGGGGGALRLCPVARRADLGVASVRTQYLRRVDGGDGGGGGGGGGADDAAAATLPTDAAAIGWAPVSPDAADVADSFHVVLLTPTPAATAALRPASNDGGAGVAAGGGSPAGVERTASTPPPLIVYPHGGPHSAYGSAYSPALTAYVRSGYAVAMANLRGSTGAPQAEMTSLLGRAGTKDVGECVAATWWALSALSDGGDGDSGGDGGGGGGDRPRVGIVGGSHGGFLGAHLSSRYPSLHAAAVLRNPVVDVASIVGGTDILDRCYTEAGVAAAGGVDGLADGCPATYPVPLPALSAMWAASPVAWVGRPAAGGAAAAAHCGTDAPIPLPPSTRTPMRTQTSCNSGASGWQHRRLRQTRG